MEPGNTHWALMEWALESAEGTSRGSVARWIRLDRKVLKMPFPDQCKDLQRYRGFGCKVLPLLLRNPGQGSLVRRIDSRASAVFQDSIHLLRSIALFARFAMNGLMPHWTSIGFWWQRLAIRNCGLPSSYWTRRICPTLLGAKCLITDILKSQEWNDLRPKHSM